MRMKYFALLLIAFITFPLVSSAQTSEIMQDKHETVLGKVVEVVSEEERLIPGTDTKGLHQDIRAEILEGDLKGRVVDIKNDYLELEEGEKFYILHTKDWQTEKDYFSVQEKYRLPGLLSLVVIFLAVALFFGRTQGFRGLLSLGISIVLIAFVLLPGILAGYSPILLTIAIASVIIILGSYITHGFNKATTAAVVGMILTVIFTGTFAYFSVHFTGLTGYESEEAVYLNFNSQGNIDIVGLLFGSIVIGLLGVLYDAAISQVVSVEELWKIAPHVSARKIYERAIRIGREHIGALVDTLAIAYVGASLPLLLLFFQTSSESPLVTINREIFATEIVRIIVGSIGLILAVPITTLVAVRMLRRDAGMEGHEHDIKGEERKLEEAGHSHSH
jgi:uncharacterized membrane protein